MVDDLDPELNAANERQDASDAARFRSEATTLSNEAAHDRTRATELAEMGLDAESDQAAKEAVAFDGRSSEFNHRAELLDDAKAHRTHADQELTGATAAHTEAEAAKTRGDHFTDQSLLTFGDVDVATTIALTREAGAARGTEAAMRDLEGTLRQNADYDITVTALDDEHQAREGLVHHPDPTKGSIVDPFAAPAASSLEPTGAEEPVSSQPDLGAEGDAAG